MLLLAGGKNKGECRDKCGQQMLEGLGHVGFLHGMV
jgi:hypothetical protein